MPQWKNSDGDSLDQETYWSAVGIYLHIAYPEMSPAKHFMMMTSRLYAGDDEKAPSEYTWGCFVNGHMKIKIKNDKLMVFTDAIQESDKVQAICDELKRQIETEWESNEIPIYH